VRGSSTHNLSCKKGLLYGGAEWAKHQTELLMDLLKLEQKKVPP
jgi:hypothetical protein